jgi:hypothetical protein
MTASANRICPWRPTTGTVEVCRTTIIDGPVANFPEQDRTRMYVASTKNAGGKRMQKMITHSERAGRACGHRSNAMDM